MCIIPLRELALDGENLFGVKLIDFSEDTKSLNFLLNAEKLRYKFSDVRLSYGSRANLRNSCLSNKINLLMIMEGDFGPTSLAINSKNSVEILSKTDRINALKSQKRIEKLLVFSNKIKGCKTKLTTELIGQMASSLNDFRFPQEHRSATKMAHFRNSSSAQLATVSRFPYSEYPYIPPKNRDVAGLLDELCDYVNTSEDHGVIKASTTLYQLLTIWPFTCYNVSLAHVISDYVLAREGYDFGGILPMEDYFQPYFAGEYQTCLNMGLPNFFYSGRNNPDSPEIWHNFYMGVFETYAKKALNLARLNYRHDMSAQMSALNTSEVNLVKFLNKTRIPVARPVDVARYFHVSNKTATNWLQKLSTVGIVRPNQNRQRITEYAVLL